MPARKKRSRLVKKRGRNKQKLLFLFLFFLFGLGLLLFFFFKPRVWDQKNRLFLAINQPGGDVLLAIFDPQQETITRIMIPGNTQVEAAFNLGTWQLSSIWQLGQDQKIGGQLLMATLTKSFKFPTDSWSSSELNNLVGDNPFKVVSSLFSFPKTNLTLVDRLNLVFFSLRVKTSHRIELNLAETGYLEKKQLIDGSLGYQVYRKMPLALATILADDQIANQGFGLVIVNQSGSRAKAEEVGEVVQVLGSKVVSVKNQNPEELDCRVGGKDSILKDKLSRIFSCPQDRQEDQETILVELKIGKQFLERF